MSFDTRISTAWAEAARDLRIRVIAPATVTLKDGALHQCEAHVLDFGSPSGAIVVSKSNAPPNRNPIDGWTSVLFESYRTYRRKHFIETLRDWGWFGESGAPDWYLH